MRELLVVLVVLVVLALLAAGLVVQRALQLGPLSGETLSQALEQMGGALRQDERSQREGRQEARLSALEERLGTLAEGVARNQAGAGERLARLEESLPRLAGVEASLRQLDAERARRERVARLEGAWRAVAQRPALAAESGQVDARGGDMAWRLEDLLARKRVWRKAIAFQQPFLAPPQVVIGINSLDVGDQEVRFDLSAAEVSPSGFVLVFESRTDARVKEARVGWLALGMRDQALPEGAPVVGGVATAGGVAEDDAAAKAVPAAEAADAPGAGTGMGTGGGTRPGESPPGS